MYFFCVIYSYIPILYMQNKNEVQFLKSLNIHLPHAGVWWDEILRKTIMSKKIKNIMSPEDFTTATAHTGNAL